MKLASFERPDEGDYRDLAIAISASILMKLWSVCRDLSCKIRVFALRVKRSLSCSANGARKSWQHNRSKIRPELTFPLTHTMPL